MSDNQTSDASVIARNVPAGFLEDIAKLRKHWWWFLVLGILLIAGGVAAIVSPFWSGTMAVLILGAVLIICGVFTIVGAFFAGKWSSFFLQLLLGILYVMAGMVIRDVPLESMAVLTLFIAAAFIVGGIFRIIVSLVERFPQWGWSLVNGLITTLAGLIIYDNYPTTALWVIGLLIGLELLFGGWTWVMVSIAIHRMPDDEDLEELAAEASSAS